MHLHLGAVHIPATRDGLQRWFLREQMQGRLTGITYEQWLDAQLRALGMTELTDEAVVTLGLRYGGVYREYFPYGRPRQPAEQQPATQDKPSTETGDEGGPVLSEAEGCCMSSESAPEPVSLPPPPARSRLLSILGKWLGRLRRQ